MKKLIIVGAGAMGREALVYARDMIAAGSAGLRFDGVAGFLDSSPTAELQLRALGVEVDFVKPIAGHVARRDCVYVVAVGNARDRRMLHSSLPAETSWANIIHPKAYVTASATLGAGILVAPFAFVGANATLGDHVLLNTYASVGHDSQVAAHCVFSPYATINGNVTLGEEVFLGTHATVIPGRKVGRCASLAAGAVVVRDVPEHAFMMGNPAKGWRKDSGSNANQ